MQNAGLFGSESRNEIAHKDKKKRKERIGEKCATDGIVSKKEKRKKKERRLMDNTKDATLQSCLAERRSHNILKISQ